MITAEETRQRLRTGAAAARRHAPSRPPWHPPAVCDFLPEMRLLAFDASLTNVGWVVLVAKDEVVVESKGTIHPADRGAVGYMSTWERARSLKQALWDVGLVVRYMRDPGTLKAVEAPAVRGHRTESSLVAGMTCWLECDECAVISATHVSAVLLGEPKIESRQRKKAIKAAVGCYVPESLKRTWTEHERDALSVGLTRLFDLREGPS
jgi:hypothetical protein